MKKLSITAAFSGLVLALSGAVLVATPADALMKIKCDSPGGVKSKTGDVSQFTGKIDPIVNHNQPQSMHTHDFFGAFGWHAKHGNAATYEQVIAAATTCRVQGDTAAYWAPVLRYISGPKAGQRVPVQQFTAYYRGFAGQTTHAGSRPLPADVRLVATDNEGYGAHGWNCGEFSAQQAREGTVDAIPNCTGENGSPGHTLTAHINFPSCWDGVKPNHNASEVGDVRDNAHFIYPTNKTACPASHPIETVQLRETIQYRYTGNGKDVGLDSDAMFGTSGGRSMHADFWNTWDEKTFATMVRDCVNTTAQAKCDT